MLKQGRAAAQMRRRKSLAAVPDAYTLTTIPQDFRDPPPCFSLLHPAVDDFGVISMTAKITRSSS